jgi:hypothetical protein
MHVLMLPYKTITVPCLPPPFLAPPSQETTMELAVNLGFRQVRAPPSGERAVGRGGRPGGRP